MRILYFGDGVWAVKSLKHLMEDGHTVLAVVLRNTPSDVTLAAFAKKHKITVVQPQTVNASEFIDWVKSQAPQLNISMSYDQILQQPILQTAPLGFINCHAGKLPFYRGRNVINWAIINNEKEIGLTIHYVDEEIDTGDIILQRSLPIDWHDTYGSVLAKVEEAFPELLSTAVKLIDENKVSPQPQSSIEGTYYGRRIIGDEWIDWNDTSLNIYNKIRAITHPGPGAQTRLDSSVLSIWKASYEPTWQKYIATPGEVVGIVKNRGIKVKTGDSTILVEKVQRQDQDESEVIPQFRIGTRLGFNLVETLNQLQRQMAEIRRIVDQFD